MLAKLGKLALLLAVMPSEASCILGEKCITVHEQGVQWKVIVTGTATATGTGQATISGTFYDCKNKQNDALLLLMNVNTPQYVAVANPRIAEASSRCIEKALDEGYIEIQCDPFDDDQDVVVALTRVGSDCPLSDLTVAKGDPEECIQGADPGATDGTTQATTTSTTTLDIPRPRRPRPRCPRPRAAIPRRPRGVIPSDPRWVRPRHPPGVVTRPPGVVTRPPGMWRSRAARPGARTTRTARATLSARAASAPPSGYPRARPRR